jgi:predicted nucleotidyltransferase
VIRTVTVEDIAVANRPPQFSVMEQLTDLFSRSQAVTHLLVRGSLASGTADRMSDIDFVIAVKDQHFIQFTKALDILMTVEASAIMPGWRDTIVRRMGGIGYVYLAVINGGLLQIDIYVVPESIAPSVQRTTGASLLYGSLANETASDPPEAALNAYIEAQLDQPASCEDLITEILILVFMMRKRIKRGDSFVVYAEVFQLMCAVKDLIRTALAPTSRYWGWYSLHEDLQYTEVGRYCLEELTALISQPLPLSTEHLTSIYQRIMAVIRAVAPESLGKLDLAVAAYANYLEIA